MSKIQVPILVELPDELIGDRVLVRSYKAGDGQAVWDAVEESREHILPWLPWGDTHRSLDDSEAFVRRNQARWLTREHLAMGIWQRNNGAFLGGSGLHRIEWDVPSFEIGYWLRRTAVGHGYMTEAVRLLSRLAFDTLNAKRVFIRCAAGNRKSAAIPPRLGFILEGTHRNAKRNASGELCDMLMFAMTPDDYDRSSIGGGRSSGA